MLLISRENLRKTEANSGNGELRDSNTNEKHRGSPITVSIFIVYFFKIFYLLLKECILYFTRRPKSLQGKVVLVTGSGRGLGRELCLQLHQKGAILACADLNEENNKKTVEMLGSRAKAYKLNVASKKQIEEVAKQIEADLGPVDILINNAALIMNHLISEWNEEEIRSIFNVNILAIFWTISVFLPKMEQRNSGHIVNISSTSAYVGTPFLSIYSCTKAAVSSLSMSVAAELSLLNPNNKIAVTTVHPTFMNTSPDYTDLVQGKIIGEKPTQVAADTIKAIEYEQLEISSPGRYGLLQLARFLPNSVVEMSIKLFVDKIVIPTKETKETSVFGKLVSSCTNPDEAI